MENKHFIREYGFRCVPVWVIGFILCIPLWAWSQTRVECPVCGQTFPKNQELCPNDGTNLKLLGKKIEVSPNPKDDDASSGVPATDDTSQTAGDGAESAKSPEADSGKYIRHDRGGTRKRISPVDEEDDWSGGRTDRERRIRGERRGESAADKRRREKRKKQEFDDLDRARRNAYASNRIELLAAREARATQDEVARQGFAALKKRSLWAQGAPFTSVGVRMAWMPEGDHPGPLVGAEIDINFIKTSVRVGLSTFLGARTLSERGELVFLESVSIGIQRQWRFSPFVLGRAAVGAMVSNRFGDTVTYLIRGLGLEAGVDCRVAEAIVVTPSMGYVRYAINEASWDSVTFKLSIGF